MDGRLKEAAPALDAVIAAARASGSRAALQLGLVYRGVVHYWQGEFPACEALMAEALVVCEDRGDGFEAFAVRMFSGSRAREHGPDVGGARRLRARGGASRARNGDRFWQPRLVSQQGYIHRELAAVEKARELDARALALARENPSSWTPEVDALMNLASTACAPATPRAPPTCSRSSRTARALATGSAG